MSVRYYYSNKETYFFSHGILDNQNESPVKNSKMTLRLIKGMNDDNLFEIAEQMNRDLTTKNKLIFTNCFNASDGLDELQIQLQLDRNQALEVAMIIVEKGYIIHAAHQLKTYVDDKTELYRFNQLRFNLLMRRKQQSQMTEDEIKEQKISELKIETKDRQRRGSLLKQVVTVASIRNHFHNNISSITSHQNRQSELFNSTNFKDPHVEPAKSLLECLANERDTALFKKFGNQVSNVFLVILNSFETAKLERSVENIDFWFLVEVSTTFFLLITVS